MLFGGFLGESFFGPMHKTLAIYAFIKFIFIRLVMRTTEHVLRHVYAFGAWSVCVYLKGEDISIAPSGPIYRCSCTYSIVISGNQVNIKDKESHHERKINFV